MPGVRNWYAALRWAAVKMARNLHWLFVLAIAACYLRSSNLDECTGPLVELGQGTLCGKQATSKDGFAYLSFQGIPYASPPVGDLRFKEPQPPQPWSGVRPGVREGHVCWQSGGNSILEAFPVTFRQVMLIFRAVPSLMSFLLHRSAQEEDCLYLNVYTRQLNGEPRPVMVWIHGGGFHMGSGNTYLYGPDYILDEDVVLVTFNYRLGPLGFLAVPSAGVAGNAGMKDQVAALRWVKDNVARFGGDPEKVTIFGESAGGTSVQMHLLSPLSRGLFHNAISQSGSALNPRSYMSADVALERAWRLAERLGLKPKDDGDLVRLLREQPAKKLTSMSESVLSRGERERGLAVHPFVPSVEDDDRQGESGEEPFLPDNPGEILAKGDFANVPYITGVNSLEAGFMLNGGRRPRGRKLDAEIERLVPSDLGMNQGSPELTTVAQKLKKNYFNKNDPDDLELAVFYSDLFVVWVVHRSINLHSRLANMPFYVYLFSFDGDSAISRRLFDKRLPGVNHGDELGYLFPIDFLPHSQQISGSPEHTTRRRLVRLWANFARTGNPNEEGNNLLSVEWPVANNESYLYLEIGRELSVGQGLMAPRINVWDELYTVHQGGLA